MTISFFVRHHDFRSPDLCAQIVIWTQLIDDAVEKLVLTLMPRQSATTITSGLGRHRLISRAAPWLPAMARVDGAGAVS